VPATDSPIPSWVLPVALLALFLGLAGVLAVAFTGPANDGERGRVRRRLAAYSLAPRPSATAEAAAAASSGALGDTQVARSAVELAGRITSRGDVESMLAGRLESGGLPLKPAEWALIHVGTTLGLGLLLLVLSDFSVLPALLGLAVGFAAPYLYLSYRTGKRRRTFEDAMPDTLQLLAGSLSAGYSLPQAVDTVSRESQGVMSSELNRAIVSARLGVPLEEALDEISTRMDSKDWSWVVMAIRINREVGGNLAEVLTTVAATMRERERLRRQVRALSAEGRLSAVILGALPVLFAAYLILVRPEYISLLITNVLGLAMLVVGVVLLLVGFVWLRKVVTVEV
jgi:tight adherence protein B